MAEDLVRYGVAVVPVFESGRRRRWNEALFRAMDDFPEFRVQGRGVQRVLGGFGALGNPSSFHHPDVRTFRRHLTQEVVKPLLDEYAIALYGVEGASDVRVETLFDRLCVRMDAFLSPSDDAWHRDIYDSATYGLRELPRSLPGGELDLLLGGWTNLDDQPQAFLGLVESHDQPFAGKKGFATFDEEEIRQFGFDRRLASQGGQTFGQTLVCDDKGEILVPPGHSVFFLQRLVHSVKSGKQPDTPALRVFHGYRLTTETNPLLEHATIIEEGGVPRLPSGQVAVMYSRNHYAAFNKAQTSCWREWGAATFRPECLFRRVTKAGVEYHTPGSCADRNPAANRGRYMPSLSEMGLWTPDKFAYSEEDLAVMRPQRLTPFAE